MTSPPAPEFRTVRRKSRRTSALLGAALWLAACAHPGPTPTPPASGETSPTARLQDEAVELLHERRFTAALAVLRAAATLDSEAAAPHAYRAIAWARMDRPDDALAACAEARRRDPDLVWVLPTCWTARLEQGGSSADAQESVRREVEALLAEGEPSLDALFAARQGFALLGDPGRRDALTLAIAARAPGTAAEADAAQMVFEAILGAADPVQRRLFAESYLSHFPDGRQGYDVARIYLRELAPGLRTADARRIASLVPGASGGHRRVAAGVASWLGDREAAPRFASALLEDALARLDREGPGPRPPFFTDEGWRAEATAERARYRYLLGRALFQAGELERAKEHLEAALRGAAVRADAHFYLGRAALDAGHPGPAIEHLRAAVERPARQAEAQALLARALDQIGWEGDPRAYFAQREGGPRFEDVTAPAGLQGQRAQRVAWGDADGDGRQDLLLDGDRLFRNRGDDTFVDVTAEAGLPAGQGANGGLWADVDDDGDLDLLTTSRSGNRLWRNEGDGRFTETTRSALPDPSPRQTEAAAWGDLDGDGALDLYLANYERPRPAGARCVADQLLHNRGDGTFDDVSQAAGVVSEQPLCGRGVTWTDFDGDGRLDIVVGNYRLDPDFLWWNRGGSFVDAAEERGVRGHQVGGAFGHTIGVASGDLDGDEDLDLYLSNLAHPRYIEFSDPSQLLLNSGPPGYRFANRFADSGIAFEETSSDPALADVDGDGDLDLYVTSIYPGRGSHLYRNRGDATFTDGTWVSGTGVLNAWGAAFADFDGDGDPDLVVASGDGVRLFRNDTEGSRWLSVAIDDRRCNRFGVGARVTIRYEGKAQAREVTAGRGTGSQDALPLAFGLGGYGGPVEVEARTVCAETLRARVDGPGGSVVLRNPAP